MDENYKCKDCNKKFDKSKDNKCPYCNSLNIQKIIPIFFGMNPIIKNDSTAHCEGGVCSFDKK